MVIPIFLYKVEVVYFVICDFVDTKFKKNN